MTINSTVAETRKFSLGNSHKLSFSNFRFPLFFHKGLLVFVFLAEEIKLSKFHFFATLNFSCDASRAKTERANKNFPFRWKSSWWLPRKRGKKGEHVKLPVVVCKVNTKFRLNPVHLLKRSLFDLEYSFSDFREWKDGLSSKYSLDFVFLGWQ